MDTFNVTTEYYQIYIITNNINKKFVGYIMNKHTFKSTILCIMLVYYGCSFCCDRCQWCHQVRWMRLSATGCQAVRLSVTECDDVSRGGWQCKDTSVQNTILAVNYSTISFQVLYFEFLAFSCQSKALCLFILYITSIYVISISHHCCFFSLQMYKYVNTFQFLFID